MAKDWKCAKCGGINPGKRTACLGCNTPREGTAQTDLGSPAESAGINAAIAPKPECVCNVCGKKTSAGQTGIVITANGVEERDGNTKKTHFSNLHRIRVFICAGCLLAKGALARAVLNKNKELGRDDQTHYWDTFDFSTLWHGDDSYLIIKDIMNDELYDNIENRNVELIFNYPGASFIANKSYFIYIDDIPAAMISISKPFRMTLKVAPGTHKINKTYIGVKELMINTEPDKSYELDCKLDRMVGGIILSLR